MVSSPRAAPNACGLRQPEVQALKSTAHRSLSTSIAPLRGITFVLLSGAFFTVSDSLSKWLRADYSVGETLSFRSLFSILFFLALIPWLGGWRTLVVRYWRSQILRAALVILTTGLFIAGLRYLPLANAIGIAFAGPIFTVIFVGPLLGESVGWRRWTAVGVGFAGVLIMVGPKGMGFELAVLFPLGTALFGALRDIQTRRMSLGDHSNATMMVSLTATVLVGTLTLPLGWVFSSQLWHMPPPSHLGLFALSGLFMGIGQYFIIESLRIAEAGLVAPFKYVSYVWALGVGFLVWQDVPDAWSITGVVLVVSSGLFIFFREQVLGRKARERSNHAA